MSDKRVEFYASDAGVELVKCRDSRLSYPLHNHVSTFTVGLILSGAIQLTLGGQKSIVSKDQFFIIAPYVPHSITAISKYSMISLCVHKDVIRQADENRIVSIAVSLLNSASDREQVDAKQALLLNAVILCKRHKNTHVAAVNYVERLKRLIEQSPEDSLTSREMSRRARKSKYHLIRSFKQEVGLTPRRFQIQNRIRKAKHLLTEPLSMTEAALAVGFFDQSHFIRHFKKIVGMTPSSYKSAFKFVRVQ